MPDGHFRDADVTAAMAFFIFDSSQHLRARSKLLPNSRVVRNAWEAADKTSATGVSARGQGEANMAQFEFDGSVAADANGEHLYQLGIMHASGRSGAADLVAAHKCFNIAAMKGHTEAARMRREIAAEMSDAEIGQAQRAARDWLKSQPAPEAPQFRAAA